MKYKEWEDNYLKINSELKDILFNASAVIKEMTEEAERGNIYAMNRLSEMYREGTLLAQNDDMYLLYLKKMIDSELDGMYADAVQAENYFSLNYPLGNIELLFPELFQDGEMIAYAAMHYCDFLFAEADLTQRKEYIEILKKANAVFKVSGSGIDSKIDNYQKSIGKETGIPASESVSSETGSDCGEYDIQLKDIFGNNVYQMLQPENRVDLATAMLCMERLNTVEQGMISGIDYSAVILPLMKALENELQCKIYKKYLEYLLSTYSADTYIKENGIVPETKKMILKKIGKSWCFLKSDRLCTLGGVAFALGRYDKGKYVPDKTAVHFCADKLINWSDYIKLYGNVSNKNNAAGEWIVNLTEDIEQIRRLRNQAAHGGTILDEPKARWSLDYLLVIRKFLVNTISVINCPD